MQFPETSRSFVPNHMQINPSPSPSRTRPQVAGAADARPPRSAAPRSDRQTRGAPPSRPPPLRRVPASWDGRVAPESVPPYPQAAGDAPVTYKRRRHHLRPARVRAHPTGARARPSSRWIDAGGADAAAAAPASPHVSTTWCWAWAGQRAC